MEHVRGFQSLIFCKLVFKDTIYRGAKCLGLSKVAGDFMVREKWSHHLMKLAMSISAHCKHLKIDTVCLFVYLSLQYFDVGKYMFHLEYFQEESCVKY